MRNGVRRILTLLTVALAGSACATSEQWAEWQQHSTHFASSSTSASRCGTGVPVRLPRQPAGCREGEGRIVVG